MRKACLQTTYDRRREHWLKAHPIRRRSDPPRPLALPIAHTRAERSGSELREAVRAPLFRAHSMVDEEQPVRIVFSLDFSQARVVAPPIRLLPFLLEVIAFAHIRSPLRHEGTQWTQASSDALRSFPACHNRWLMFGNSRIGGSLAVGRDDQSEGSQHGWIHGGVLRCGDRLRWRSGQSLIEVQCERVRARAGKQRSSEPLLHAIL